VIVTTGKIIKVQIDGYSLERTAEKPGQVAVLHRNGQRMDLSSNAAEAQRFIDAYKRVIDEDIGYRKRDCE
jgi:hypothetical protein